MKTIITLTTFVIILSTQALAQTGGDLHVKGKIRSDSLANQNYLLIYADSTGTLDTLEPGAAGQVLISNGLGGKPYWGTSSGSDSILYASFTNVGTDADTLEKVLGSYIMPGNTLNTDGSWIEIEVFGTISNTTDTTRIKLKFGGDILREYESYDGSFNNLQFAMNSIIYRVNNNLQKSLKSPSFIAVAALGVLKTHTKDLSTNIDIEVIGQNGAGSPFVNNIVLEGLIVRLIK